MGTDPRGLEALARAGGGRRLADPAGAARILEEAAPAAAGAAPHPLWPLLALAFFLAARGVKSAGRARR